MQKLPIEYNRKRDLAFVTNDPYTFLTLDSLYDKITYISDSKQKWLQSLDLNGESKYILTSKTQGSGDAGRFLRSKKVAEFIMSRPKMNVDMYAPVDPPYRVNPLRLLMNSPAIAHAYENKRYFRDEFSDLIRMPEYVVRYVTQLDKAASYRDLTEELDSTKIVLQDEQSSGSKGTFMVDSADSYIDAVKSLKKSSSGGSVIVSKAVSGVDMSIQVCITRHGIFTSGVNQQLVDTPELCNSELAGATKWCGGVVNAEPSEIVFHQAREIATVIGSELSAHGYKGVFGIDLIVTPNNEVYAIEINARHTGYTQLISDIQLTEGKIPFSLLNVLELANEEYVVQEMDALPSYTSALAVPYTYLILNNFKDGEKVLSKTIEPGVYEVKGDSLQFIKPGYSVSDIESDDQILIMSRYQEGDSIQRGHRIVKMISRGNLTDGKGLSTHAKKIVTILKNQFEIQD